MQIDDGSGSGAFGVFNMKRREFADQGQFRRGRAGIGDYAGKSATAS